MNLVAAQNWQMASLSFFLLPTKQKNLLVEFVDFFIDGWNEQQK